MESEVVTIRRIRLEAKEVKKAVKGDIDQYHAPSTPLRIGKDTPYCLYRGRGLEAWKKLEAGDDRNVKAIIRRGKIVKDAMAKENS